MSIQQFCLRWNNHQPNFISVFTSLLNTESLVDVTLAAEGKHLQAHKVVLSACSVYFQTLFTANPSRHPIVILKDVKYSDLRIMVDFMYYGEVNVSQEQLPQILETAKMLKIKGLTEMPDSTSLTKSQSTSSDMLTPGESSWESQRHSISPCNLSPSVKRKRLRKASTGSGSTSVERNSEDKAYEASSAQSVNLVKSDSITLSTLPHSRRKDTYQEYKEADENGTVDGNMHQSTEDANNCARTVENQLEDQTATNLTQQGKSKSRRAKFLIRQGRVKKDSESTSTPTDEGPGTSGGPSFSRQSSEPLPPKIMLQPGAPLFKKQASHPAHQYKVKVTGTITPLILTDVRTLTAAQAEEIVEGQLKTDQERGEAEQAQGKTDQALGKSEKAQGKSEQEQGKTEHTHARSDSQREIITCESDLPMSTEAQLDFREETPEIYDSLRSSHCPAIRSGPALSCNFCWNTIDSQGRVLRRKTKYHCPECQANLCIVPCFHEYHERNAN